MLRKVFKPAKIVHWTILEKWVVDEIIFRTTNPRNRLMLELMARGGMRVSEVLKLTPNDVEGRKLVLRDPKSGKQMEVVFVPQKVADRLKEYVDQKGIGPNERIFPLTYQGARAVVVKAGNLVGIHPWPRPVLSKCGDGRAGTQGPPNDIMFE